MNDPYLTNWERRQHEADGGAHARLAQGLREIARFIETHPGLPIPSQVTIGYTIPAATDKDGEDEAYRIAGILGAKVDGQGGNARTGHAFGPDVSYTADYLTQGFMAAYDAHMKPWLTARISALREGRRAA